jgi:hypothetical protein
VIRQSLDADLESPVAKRFLQSETKKDLLRVSSEAGNFHGIGAPGDSLEVAVLGHAKSAGGSAGDFGSGKSSA